MKSWLEYLAFLNWQGLDLNLEDFKKVFQNQDQIHSVEQMYQHLSQLSTRSYLQNTKSWWRQIEHARKEYNQLNIKMTWPFHPDYPNKLLEMEKPPLTISWKGTICWKDRFLFSIVGSRRPYEDTLTWMDIHLSAFLKKVNQKICVMSGGARGVDQKAHALSLSTQNPTLCFLPCGITRYYPSTLKKWEKHILDGGGAFISVFPAKAYMQKSHFHIRNKVLAYLSHLAFIAQAQSRSGTMVTARFALHAGCNIAVLPGSPLYAGYSGNLSLINDGCFMIRDHLDLETLFHSCQMTLQ